MKITKLLALLMSFVLLCGCLTACGEEEETPVVDNAPKQNKLTSAYADKAYGFQLEMPADKDTVAIMHTSMGDIAVRFFPEGAPKAVENFLTHAREGYYNGVTFHRVMNDFMIQGGDPKGDGTGGESIWGEKFEDEFNEKLLNLRGALSMANSNVNTNGSQFFINQKKPNGMTAEQLKSQYSYTTFYNQMMNRYAQSVQVYGEYFTSQYPDVDTYIDKTDGIYPDSRLVPDEVWDLYAKYGGNISLDGAWRAKKGHTVFGQVFEGMDVVDAIAAVQTGTNNKPVASVIIESIEVTTYAEYKNANK